MITWRPLLEFQRVVTFMFSHLPKPTLDPILSLSVAYRGDPRTDKVDLGIGVYKNDQGETPIMKAVSKAQDIVVETQKTKAYVGQIGRAHV